MTKMQVSDKLQGDYGEIIFEHFCQKNKYAYISLEDIYKSFTPKNVLVFRFGYQRIPVNVPAEIVQEIREFCCPSNGDEKDPSFVFDYLTVSTNFSFIRQGKYLTPTKQLTKSAFNWIEVKTGKSKLTPNQQQKAAETRIGLHVFRIPVEMPEKVEVNFEKYYEKK